MGKRGRSGRMARLEKLALCAALTCFVPACAAQKPPPPASTTPEQEPPLDDPATCVDTEPVHADPSARTDAAPVADADTPDGSGDRGPEAIRKTVRDNHLLLGACYQLGLGRHAALRGRVTFRFVIQKDGTISDLVVADNELPDCSVVHCLRETMLRVTFPQASGTTTVEYPIMFEPPS